MDLNEERNKTLALIEFILFCCFNGLMLCLAIYLLIRTCRVSSEDVFF